MSATKAVIGILIGILEAKGDVEINVPIAKYVPEMEGSVYSEATIRDLTDMRMEIKLEGEALAAYENCTNWEPADPKNPEADFRSFFSGPAFKGSPAKRNGNFLYVSGNIDLLGWILERATGQTIATLITEHLWKPMGAESDAYITLDRKGLARCTGGLCSTARDLARIGQLMLSNGRSPSGTQIIPQAWVEDILTNGSPEAWRDGEFGKSFGPISKNMRYRAGWYAIGDEGVETSFAMGIHGQNMFLDRKRGLVVVKLSSWKEPIINTQVWATHKAFARLQRGMARG